MGRPKRTERADGAATRARILESAGELFGSHGLVVTGKAIAARAGVDTASINYHFGGRDGLYRAVLVEAHHRFIGLEELIEISGRGIPPEDKLAALIDAAIGHLAAGSHWSTTILARELLAPSPHIAVLRDEAIPPKAGIVLRILSEITGIPEGSPDLACCLVSVLAPCGMLLIADQNEHVRGVVIPPVNPWLLARHLHRFALAGLRAAGAHYRSGP